MQFKNIQLSKGKEEAVLRRHPWIFSGAINAKGSDACVDGDLVAVYTFNNKLLGYGHWNDGSIAVRIISFGEQIPNQQFWTNRFANAFASDSPFSIRYWVYTSLGLRCLSMRAYS